MFRFFLILIFSIFFSANLNAHADHNKDLNKIEFDIKQFKEKKIEGASTYILKDAKMNFSFHY